MVAYYSVWCCLNCPQCNKEEHPPAPKTEWLEMVMYISDTVKGSLSDNCFSSVVELPDVMYQKWNIKVNKNTIKT